MSQFIKGVEDLLDEIIKRKETFLQKILKPAPLWVTPDQLTLIRILCIFPIIFFLLGKKLFLAFSFYTFGALLDLIDGPLARVRKKETDLGKRLDPFADKILFGVTFIILVLAIRPSFSKILFWLIFICEFILVALSLIGKNFMVYKGLKKKLGANLWGKWKFTLQFFGIYLLIFNQLFFAHIVLWVSLILAIASIIGHLTFKEEKP
ncbi:MAG: CDP-diacylglycerol--glycerol-3-phosphate 3-phosphatidyltransferase [Parcubacteria group bacterium Athens1014_10]|nr:MAG: CDP-diacylglycerol--glycerol-3-phosphate 3-phosphatidyltransferase [Parcubacteria group bacterium Athens1014_10]TSD05903.1 MAG: CDP-diacylglycerol--glycerol-3-phosphate 3-phosphatidyltransferase [Parcubacteria group bacterium Athens0714_12]